MAVKSCCARPCSCRSFLADSTINAGFCELIVIGGRSVSDGIYSSITTWALAPPAPKAETPAMRGYTRLYPLLLTCGRFHGANTCCTTKGVSPKSIWGFNTVECSDGANLRCFSCNSTLVTPAIPAALSQCPILDLTEPMAQNCLSDVYFPNVFTRLVISIGSPNEVPVPWASI